MSAVQAVPPGARPEQIAAVVGGGLVVLSDGFQTYELSEDLWLLTDVAGKPAAKKLSIRHIAADQAFARQRTYVPSSDGRSVLYTEGGTVHAIDVASDADHALASDFQAGSLAPRCDAACVVF